MEGLQLDDQPEGVVQAWMIKLKALFRNGPKDHTMGVVYSRKIKLRVWLVDCGWNIELMEWVGAGELDQGNALERSDWDLVQDAGSSSGSSTNEIC